jgi:hypothetical protein
MNFKHIILGSAIVLAGLINTLHYYRKSKSYGERWFVAKYSTLGWLVVLIHLLICQVARGPIALVVSIGFLAAFIPFCHYMTGRWKLIRKEDGDYPA